MTGYRLRSTAPTGPSIARERADEWDASDGATGSDVDLVGRAGELIAELATLLAPTDVYDRVGVDGLRTHQDDLARLSGLATAALAKAAKAYARAGGLQDDGTPSMNSHFRKGRSNREANELARLARAADDTPDTVDALARGELSPAGADAIAGAVKNGRLGPDPAKVEQDLLAIGKGASSEHIRNHIKREEQRRDGARLRKDEARQHQMRRLSVTERPDGMFGINGLLPSELGAKTKTLLDALTTRDPVSTPDNEKRDSVQRTADAFADVVDWMLDHRNLPTKNGQARPHVNVTVRSETVVADLTNESGDGPIAVDDPRWADLAGGTLDWTSRPLSPQAIRRICGNASVPEENSAWPRSPTPCHGEPPPRRFSIR